MEELLQARDARQEDLLRLLEGGGAASVLWLGINVPGPRKLRPGVSRLARGALEALARTIPLEPRVSRTDPLGPFLLAESSAPPEQLKRAALALEQGNHAGRLLDLDVYRPDGTQADRAALGLSPRPCLLCPEPAVDCMRLGRHREADLLRRVDELLAPLAPAPALVAPERLAATLARGTLRELELTPKPGLVDRRDNGSHPDLCLHAMRLSAALLPRYYARLLRLAEERRPLAECVQAGVEAEARMVRAIGSNAHRGYIFLSGIVLLAACACAGRSDRLRQAIADLAGEFFAGFAAQDSHGAGIRARRGLGGIRREAEQGLPAVFQHGWPSYREALEAGWPPGRAAFYLMAELMEQVEDTTAVHRCGPEGLACLRRDGAVLRRLLERGAEPESWLAERNREYRRMGLTMGGVADCMALTFALEEAAEGE